MLTHVCAGTDKVRLCVEEERFIHHSALVRRMRIVAGKRAFANRISGLNSFLMHSFPMQQLFLAFPVCASILCPQQRLSQPAPLQITKCKLSCLFGYLWIVLNCIIGGCLRDASGVQSPNIRSLCTLFNQFKFRKPQSDPERASTALHGAVAALNGGRWRRSPPFGISYYALLHGRHRAEYKRRRAEGGGGRERQREREERRRASRGRQETGVYYSV